MRSISTEASEPNDPFIYQDQLYFFSKSTPVVPFGGIHRELHVFDGDRTRKVTYDDPAFDNELENGEFTYELDGKVLFQANGWRFYALEDGHVRQIGDRPYEFFLDPLFAPIEIGGFVYGRVDRVSSDGPILRTDGYTMEEVQIDWPAGQSTLAWQRSTLCRMDRTGWPLYDPGI